MAGRKETDMRYALLINADEEIDRKRSEEEEVKLIGEWKESE